MVVDDEVGVAQRSLGRDKPRFSTPLLAIDTLAGEVGEVDDTLGNAALGASFDVSVNRVWLDPSAFITLSS